MVDGFHGVDRQIMSIRVYYDPRPILEGIIRRVIVMRQPRNPAVVHGFRPFRTVCESFAERNYVSRNISVSCASK